MVRVGAPWPAMGKLTGEEGEGGREEGEGEGGARGAPWGLGPAAPLSVEGAPAFCKCCSRLLYVRRRREGGKREEKENKKKKKCGKFSGRKMKDNL
jgi:hypothetical protein